MNKLLKIFYFLVLVFLILLLFLKEVDFRNMFYKNIKEVKNPNDILVLVNKNNKLSEYFVPNDLETIDVKYSNEGKMLKKEAKEAFERLSEDASKLGYKIVAVSGYRDYKYQENLFNYYVDKYGEDYALSCSAKPGHSEHQTGLAVDVMGSNNSYDDFEMSDEFEWMSTNSYKYGFILRYPSGKENITGFKYEPWHYRYVGEEVAKIIYENNLVFEEYLKGDY